MKNKKELHFDIDRRVLYLLSFLIPLAILIVMMAVQGVQPFGGKSILIIDGLHQYMPFFSILYDKLKSGGSLLYTFRCGLGINFLGLYAYYLSSPLNFLILLFKKTQLNMAVSMLIVLKLALSGLTSGIYFSTKTKKPGFSVLMVSTAYALNAYMIGYCWNVMWLDAIMIFPIVILGIERLIEKRDGRVYGLALFYALYCNYYIAFMICIFAVIWYMFYHFTSVKQFFFRGIAFALWSFLAAGLAAVLLIPAYMGIKATSSGESMIIPAHSWLTSFWNLISRQYDLSSPITHDNFDGNINLYVGTFAILCLFLYLLNRKIRWLDKLKYVLLVVFFYISFNEGILNFIWHGFHDQYGIPNRFSFLLGFVLLSMVLELFENKEEIKNWQIILSCLCSLGILILSRNYVETPMEDGVYGLIGMMTVLYSFVLFIMTIDKKHQEVHSTLFCLIAIAEIAVATMNGFSNAGNITVSTYFSGTEDMAEATETMKEENVDQPFYRSELAQTKMVDEAAWYDFNAISLFGSTARDKTVEIMDSLGFYTGCNEYLYRGANPVTNLMFGVKYLYYHDGDDLMTNFDYDTSFGSFDVYENPVQNLSIGYAIDDYIDNWYYDSDYPFTVLNDFCYQGYDVDNIFETMTISDPVTNGSTAENTNDGEYYFEYQEKEADNLLFTLPALTANQDLYIFYDGTQVENVDIAVNGQVVRSGDLDGSMQLVNGLNAGDVVTLSMQLKGEAMSGYVRLSAATFNQNNFDQFAAKMTSGAIKVESMSDTHIKGTVTANDYQYLYFSIPYDTGWTVYIDGKKTDTMTIGDAFLATPIDAGTHEVELRYTSPGFSIGWKITLICLLIFIFICVFTPKIRKLREEREAKKEAEREAKRLKELEEKFGIQMEDTDIEQSKVTVLPTGDPRKSQKRRN